MTTRASPGSAATMVGKQSELIALGRTASLDHDGAEEREPDVGHLGNSGVEVAAFGLEHGPFEARE